MRMRTARRWKAQMKKYVKEQYELELKRTKLFGAPKQELLYNSENINQVLDRIYNDGYKIVCDCGFKFSENFSDEELVKHEPIIVFNDVDPFGEEDWEENFLTSSYIKDIKNDWSYSFNGDC